MTVNITYFVHGTTLDNEKNISSGWNDVVLSKLGIQQSLDLKKLIDIKNFDIVFCSDLKRAISTSELVFGNYIKIERDLRLRECNYGDFNGKSSEIVEPLQEKNIKNRFPNGESYEDVKLRINDFLKYVKKNYEGKNIAIIGHKAPQLSLDVIINNLTWEEAFKNDWRKTKSWKPGWKYKYN